MLLNVQNDLKKLCHALRNTFQKRTRDKVSSLKFSLIQFLDVFTFVIVM
jgi:hypothetical protein